MHNCNEGNNSELEILEEARVWMGLHGARIQDRISRQQQGLFLTVTVYSIVSSLWSNSANYCSYTVSMLLHICWSLGKQLQTWTSIFLFSLSGTVLIFKWKETVKTHHWSIMLRLQLVIFTHRFVIESMRLHHEGLRCLRDCNRY